MSETTAKFDFLFQNKVISLFLNNNEFLNKYGTIVQPEYFSDISHQYICKVINTYYNNFSCTPSIEVLIEEIDKLEDKELKQLTVNTIQEILKEEVIDLQYYENNTIEFCKRQAVLLAMRQATQLFKDGDIETIIPTIEQAMSIGNAADPSSIGTNYWNDFDKVELNTITPSIPTMLGESGSGGMDDVLNGGLEQENVGLIVMPVGRGKSTFLVNVACNSVLQGYNTVYISLELSEKQLRERCNSYISGLSVNEQRKMQSSELKSYILENYTNWKMGEFLIKTFPMKSVTMRQIEAHLKLLKSTEGWFPDLLVIDYLDHVKPSTSSKERHESLETVSIDFKASAQRMKIPIWTASQVNKEGAKKNVASNEDIAGSYAKTFALDVIFVGIPKSDQETDERTVELFCSKNRQGKDQMLLHYDIDFETMRYTFKPQEYKMDNAALALRRFSAKRGKR